MKKRAYTLAEVLIALGIVGVIAATMLPLVNKAKPDKNKVLYLKAYDSLTRTVSALANNSKAYKGYYEKSPDELYNLTKYPFLDTTKGQDPFGYEGSDKLGNLIRDALNGTGTAAGFNTRLANMKWVVENKTPNAANGIGGSGYVKFYTEVTVDVNGDEKGPNSFYDPSNPTQEPDKFKFYITASGNVVPVDVYGQMLVDRRKHWLKKEDDPEKYTEKKPDDLPDVNIPQEEFIFPEDDEPEPEPEPEPTEPTDPCVANPNAAGCKQEPDDQSEPSDPSEPTEPSVPSEPLDPCVKNPNLAICKQEPVDPCLENPYADGCQDVSDTEPCIGRDGYITGNVDNCKEPEPEDPCIKNPNADGCRPNQAPPNDPSEPSDPDPCVANPDAAGCKQEPVDPCVKNPNASGCKAEPSDPSESSESTPINNDNDYENEGTEYTDDCALFDPWEQARMPEHVQRRCAGSWSYQYGGSNYESGPKNNSGGAGATQSPEDCTSDGGGGSFRCAPGDWYGYGG